MVQVTMIVLTGIDTRLMVHMICTVTTTVEATIIAECPHIEMITMDMDEVTDTAMVEVTDMVWIVMAMDVATTTMVMILVEGTQTSDQVDTMDMDVMADTDMAVQVLEI